MTSPQPHGSCDLQFGDDDRWEVDPVYAERDRYKAALEAVWNHPTDMACDGECAARMNAIAGRALGKCSSAPGRTEPNNGGS